MVDDKEQYVSKNDCTVNRLRLALLWSFLLTLCGPGLLVTVLNFGLPIRNYCFATKCHGMYVDILIVTYAWALFLLSVFGWPLFAIRGAWVAFKAVRRCVGESRLAAAWLGVVLCSVAVLSLLYWATHISYIYLWLSNQPLAEATRAAH